MRFNIDEAIREMVSIMQNNYDCHASTKTKFNWAKRDLLQQFSDVIENNRYEIIEELTHWYDVDDNLNLTERSKPDNLENLCRAKKRTNCTLWIGKMGDLKGDLLFVSSTDKLAFDTDLGW